MIQKYRFCIFGCNRFCVWFTLMQFYYITSYKQAKIISSNSQEPVMIDRTELFIRLKNLFSKRLLLLHPTIFFLWSHVEAYKLIRVSKPLDTLLMMSCWCINEMPLHTRQLTLYRKDVWGNYIVRAIARCRDVMSHNDHAV